jgi:hypothetical protein
MTKFAVKEFWMDVLLSEEAVCGGELLGVVA